MKIIYKILIIGVVLFSISACIDELNIDVEGNKRILVVEGFITTQPGPHRVMISKSAKYGSILDEAIIRETGATVWVRDEDGEQVFFEEDGVGSYYTPVEFKATVGKKYTLFIVLANGERFVSVPEEIHPVPPIDSLIVLFKKQPSLSDITFGSGVEVYARWQDPIESDNFYMWDASGIYLLNTRPELFLDRGFFGDPFINPKDCCSTCYITEHNVNTELKIFKDNLSNGIEHTELVAYIPDDGGRFMDKYMVVIEQASLTKEAFQFFDILKNQLSIQGNIFDPPPATIRGNIISLDNPDDEVIGYFRASDSFRDTLFISKDAILETQPIRWVNDDCRVLENSTTEKPPFWE